jgi:hypothetical protein
MGSGREVPIFQWQIVERDEMDSNFKRKLIAGLFAPVLGLSVSAALAQSSSGSTSGGTSGSAASSGSTSGSQSGTSGTSGAARSGTAGGVNQGSQGMSGSSSSGMSGSAGMSGTASWNAQTFNKLDTNHDGVLSREEAQADPSVRDAWSRLDAKSSGRVSKADFEKFRGTQSGTTGTTTGSSASGTGQKVGGPTGTGGSSSTSK